MEQKQTNGGKEKSHRDNETEGNTHTETERQIYTERKGNEDLRVRLG